MKKNLLLLLLFVFSLFASSPAFSQERKGKQIKVTKSAVVEFSTIEVFSKQHPADPNVKRIGGTIDGEGEGDEEGEMPKMKIPKKAKVIVDPFGKMPVPTLQKPSPGTNSSASFSPIIDFNGIDDINSTIPPDIGGQIGPNHVMTTLNSFVRISSRTGTAISTVSLNAFFSSVGAPSTFDPKILYDPYNNRWVITACGNAVSANSALLVGVSQTNDPTGAWNLYSIDVDATNTNWFDYPSIGFNKDWIVIGGNMFTVSANGFTSGKLYVFKKADLYAALPSPAVTVINAGSSGFTLVPAVTYDNTISTIYLTQNFNGNSGGNGLIGFYTITGAVGSEVLSAATFVSTPNPWGSSAGVTNFAPQAGTANKVACNDDRMQKTIYRNGSIWCTQSVFLPAGAPTRSAVQWWQLNMSAGIVQRGRIDDASATNFYAFPSIDVNKNDDAMIGCAKFSATTFPSATYAIRMATDPVNTFRNDFVYKAGLAKYFKTFSGTSNRWGDYTSVCVDPVNDVNFWTVQEYAMLPQSGTVDLWGTWWAGVNPTSISTPDIRFQQTADAQSETTISTTGCRGYKDYTYNLAIANSPTGTATVTLGVANGGTATQNVDYEILTTTLTFPDGSGASQPFTVRIYDDAAKESAETFTLNYTISGTTNAQAGAFNQTLTFTINDNDVAPIAPTSLSGTIGINNANLTMPFRGNFFDARTQLLYSASELTTLGFTAGNITSIGFNVTSKSSTSPYNGFTIRLKNTSTPGLTVAQAFEGGGTQVYSQNYSTVAGMNTLPITPFAWDGFSNLLVDLCFDNSIAVGLDQVAGTTANANCIFDRQNTNIIAGCSIATSVFGFNGGARPVITLAISVTGTPVSTALNSTRTAYLGPNDDVYFYDGAGAIMARIKNNTAFDYGCTEVTIDRNGTSSAQFWNSNTPNYLASKSVKVVPANNTTSGNYDISLYYTNSEVTGFEAAATPTTFSSSKLVKVSNGFFVPDVSAATPHINDVLTASGTVTALGSNKVMTGNFSSTGFSGFGIGDPGAVCSATLSSAVGTDNQMLCINTPITDITFSTSGATGIGTALNLPTGVTASWSANVLTITGTPTVAGSFNFSIPFIGCTGSNATGTITITNINTASTASSSPAICNNTTLTDITHTTSGATGIANDGISGANSLPAGVLATWASNTITISGTPTVSGTFTYSIPLTGGCGSVNAIGTITVKTPVGITSISAGNNPICGGTRTVLNAVGVTGTNAVVTWYDAPGATGNVVGTGLTSDSVFVGIYYAYVTGDCGSPIEASFTITGDATNPLISCPNNVNVNNTNAVNCAKAVVLTSPTFSDNCKVKALSWTMTGATTAASSLTGIRPINGITLNGGTTTITYTVRDFSDLTNTCSFTVTINDIVKPLFTTAPANINVSIPTGCSTSINVSDVSFSDNCGTPSLAWSATGATIGNGTNQVGTMVFNIGTTTLTYTLTDANSNVRSVSILVKVVETELPIITCPSNITTSTVGTSCTKNIASVDPTYSDNCGIKSLTWSTTGATSLSSPATGIWTLKTKNFKAGLTTVTYVVKDFSGNSATCSYNVQLNTTNTCPIANKASSIVSEEINPSSIEVFLFPNPTGDVFNVTVKAPKQESIYIRVLDVNGKTAFIAKGMPKQTFHFGEQLKIGTYLVEVRQGKVVKTLKAVKIVN